MTVFSTTWNQTMCIISKSKEHLIEAAITERKSIQKIWNAKDSQGWINVSIMANVFCLLSTVLIQKCLATDFTLVHTLVYLSLFFSPFFWWSSLALSSLLITKRKRASTNLVCIILFSMKKKMMKLNLIKNKRKKKKKKKTF